MLIRLKTVQKLNIMNVLDKSCNDIKQDYRLVMS